MESEKCVMLHELTSRVVRFQTHVATPESRVCLCRRTPCKKLLCSLCYSTQSAVSLSARSRFKVGGRVWGRNLHSPGDLSVGGIGNCKDKSLPQLKSVHPRAFGMCQISEQIEPCPLFHRKVAWSSVDLPVFCGGRGGGVS